MKINKLSAGALGVAAIAVLAGCSTSTTTSTDDAATKKPAATPSSFVYTESNAAQNEVLVFAKDDAGKLTKFQTIRTGGAGTDGRNPVTGEDSSPDALFSAGAVTRSADGKFVFAVNAGDGSVTSFTVGEDGKLSRAGKVSTGDVPKSLAFDAATSTLYVLHTFGPNHLTTVSVAKDGSLTDTGHGYTVNTADAADRVATQAVVSPDGEFVIVDTVFDARPSDAGLTPANADRKDGLAVFPIESDGSLGDVVFTDAGGAAPFTLTFEHGSDDKFVTALVGAEGAAPATLNDDGTVTPGEVAQVDLSAAPNGPAETCWIAFSPDNKYVYATNFGLGTVASYTFEDGKLTLLDGTAATEASPDGYQSLAGVDTSGPGDSWVSEDGYFYQLYANADKIVGYDIEDDGSLTKVTEVKVQHNSTTGLIGS